MFYILKKRYHLQNIIFITFKKTILKMLFNSLLIFSLILILLGFVFHENQEKL